MTPCQQKFLPNRNVKIMPQIKLNTDHFVHPFKVRTMTIVKKNGHCIFIVVPINHISTTIRNTLLLYYTDIKTQFAFMNNTSKCIRSSNSYYPLIIWRAIDTYQKAKK